MPVPLNVLILGASYGSLLATKIALAGHNAQLVCRQVSADLINTEGTRVRMPIKGRADLLEISSQTLPGRITAAAPASVDVSRFDLAVLAMQEPQYSETTARDLLVRIGKAGVPCLSLMNMPPLPFLARLPGVDTAALADCYADASVWAPIVPALMTLCSPDPQAVRPADQASNVLEVRLPTNFKAARFESEAHTAMLHRLDADIEAVRYDDGHGGKIELPVKLKVHHSLFVPLAKWPMLIAGNYRCISANAMRPIRDAVHGDLEQSRAVYEWVVETCGVLGADAADMVPFDKYAAAAKSLANPSSVARALAGGATGVERVDRLVQRIAAQKGRRHPVLDTTVASVDGWIVRNTVKPA
jgi:hypothetical protein